MSALSQSFHGRRAPRVLDNRIMRKLTSIGVIVALAALSSPVAAQEKSFAAAPSMAGAWTRNKDLSDVSAGRGQQADDDSGRGDGRGRGDRGGGRRGGGGGFGGGGFGRGGMGRGGGDGAGRGNPEEMTRMREAMRDVTNPSDHLTITQAGSMIVLTGADGRTTRLSPDGKKIKDDNTRVERKTRWDGETLVSEINGLGPGKMTQTFAVDPGGKLLRITLVMEGGRQPRTITQVYDADPR